MELKYGFDISKPIFLLVLIAPLWNWNKVSIHADDGRWQVLIAPLWNWNCVNYKTLHSYLRSNRTFMELKCTMRCRLSIATSSSNRTFMELKLRYLRKTYRYSGSSNRTFMELKYTTVLFVTLLSVLIAPLWNWNSSLLILRLTMIKF